MIRKKQLLSTGSGHYVFNVMPFGPIETFQSVMECVLPGLRGEQCLVHLDDVIVFSNTFQEHLKHLSNVLKKGRFKIETY